MKLLITGSSGLIGVALRERLLAQGHEVTPLVRRAASAGEIAWDPEKGQLDASQIRGFDAVVNLAGESIAGKRWSPAQKEKILASRIDGTKLLAKSISQLAQKPSVFVSASAIGYYGDRGDEVLTEASDPGKGFLPDVCSQWEAATRDASDAGVRVPILRFGVVLASQGGALAAMLPPFRLGLGGPMGSGLQWMSWIALADVCGMIVHALNDTTLSGPVNVVSPSPITNSDFAHELGKAIKRPAVMPLPSFAAKLIFGQMADELLLGSNRVIPEKAKASGYAFQFPEVAQALTAIMSESP